MARLHATTGEPPAVRLEREREVLQPLPAGGFDPRVPESRRVMTDCTVSFSAGFYSVPHHLVGTRVVVKIDPLGDAIENFAGAERLAEHRRVGKGERSVIEEHVAPLRRPRIKRLRERAGRISKPKPRVAELVSLVTWPRIEVAHRPIEEYVVAVGGTR